MAEGNVIEVKGLSKHFKLPKGSKNNTMQGSKKTSNRKATNNIIKAVDSIDLSVREGEIFGFLGPNGAGKTTTIRMLTGVLRPTSGTIHIYRRELRHNLLQIQQLMGHVPEMANAYPDLTGWENLSLIGQLYGLKRSVRETRAQELLQEFGIYEFKDLKAKNYSKGMKQRLLLCMALLSNPKILFLDEPTSGLDVQSSIIIKDLIKKQNKQGMTIILTTHDLDVANQLSDRIAIINKGKIVGLDTPARLRKLKQEFHAIDFWFTPEPLDMQTFEQLTAVKETKKLEEQEQGYRFVVQNLHDGICQVVNHADTQNLVITKINTYEPHLQDVFLKIIADEAQEEN